MKFIKLTNTADQHKGDPIYINPDFIAAIYDFAREEGGSRMTILYGGPTGNTWYVEEGLTEVIKLINESSS